MEYHSLIRNTNATKKSALIKMALGIAIFCLILALTAGFIAWYYIYYLPEDDMVVQFVFSRTTSYPDPPRLSFAAGVWRDRVYMVGGHIGDDPNSFDMENFSNKTIYCNLTTMEWYDVSGDGGGGPALEQAAMKVYGDFLYVFGGLEYDGNSTNSHSYRSLNTIHRYDITNNQWEMITTMPHPRSSHAVGILDTKAYIIGGWDATPRYPQWHKTIDVFDFHTQDCTETNYTIVPRRDFTLVELGTNLVLLGGLTEDNTTSVLTKVLLFSPNSTTPFMNASSLVQPIRTPGVGEMSESLVFVFGGVYWNGSAEGVYSNMVYSVGDGVMGEWVEVETRLMEPKAGMVVVKLDESKLGLLGGVVQNGTVLKYFDIFQKEEVE